MNRRNFLAASLAGTTGGILVAADMLSTKTFFLPPAGGWLQKPRPIIYGTIEATMPVHPWSVATVRMREPRIPLNLYDLISVNGEMHRVAGLEHLSGGIGGPSEIELQLVRA